MQFFSASEPSSSTKRKWFCHYQKTNNITTSHTFNAHQFGRQKQLDHSVLLLFCLASLVCEWEWACVLISQWINGNLTNINSDSCIGGIGWLHWGEENQNVFMSLVGHACTNRYICFIFMQICRCDFFSSLNRSGTCGKYLVYKCISS